MLVASSSNSLMASISVPMAMLVTRLEHHFDHHRHLELFHPGIRLLDGRRDLFLLVHTHELAAQALDHRLVVDTIAPQLGRVDVLEAELHAVVHREAALALADQAEVAVVHHHVNVGQLELRADGQFLDHELEVVVARQRDDAARGVGGTHAQRGGNRPAQRAGLAAVDPLARAEDMQELRAGDLAQADGGHIDGVARKDVVHALIDPLRLHRHRCRSWSCAASCACARGIAPTQLLRSFSWPAAFISRGDLDEQLQRGFGVRHDAQVGREDAADLRRLDVHVHERAALAIHLGRAGMAIGPAVADAKNEIARQHRRVAVAVQVCRPHMPAISRWSSGIAAPAHQRRDHRHVDESRQTAAAARLASALMTPPPATISGAEAACIMARPSRTCLRVAAGL